MAKKNDKAARRRKKARALRDALPLEYPSARSYTPADGTERGVIVGPTKTASRDGKKLHFTFDLVDLDRGAETERIVIDFFAHGFSFDPTAPRRAVLFEKRGPGGAHVDLLDREVLQVIPPMTGFHFYGHGTYDPSGDVVFAVESHLDDGSGAISVRDAKTFAVLERFPTFGVRPHDCVLIDQGRTLAITNGGGKLGSAQLPNVAFVHIESRTLLEKHEVENERINMGHIAVGAGHDFAVVSAPRDGLPEDTSLGGVSLRTDRKPMVHLGEPAEVIGQLRGETLSVALHGDTVVATTPLAGMMTFWSLRNKCMLQGVLLENVRGVTTTLDGAFFAISCGTQATLVLYDTKTLEQVPYDGGRARFSGSHLYTWARPRD